MNIQELFANAKTELIRPKQTGWIQLDYDVMAAPRPRASAMNIGGKTQTRVYNPNKYSAWKEGLAWLIKSQKFPAGEYNTIDILIGIPIPKSLSKKKAKALEFTLHEKKPDFDNFAKGIVDAIQQSGKILNDSKFGSGKLEKVWIPQESKPFIMFNLRKEMYIHWIHNFFDFENQSIK